MIAPQPIDPRIELIMRRAVPERDAEHPHRAWRRLSNGADRFVGYLTPKDLNELRQALIKRL